MYDCDIEIPSLVSNFTSSVAPMSQVTKKDILPYIIGAVGLGFGIVMAVKASKPEKEELGAVIKADCKSDWNKVDKNAKNRVERKAFVSVLLAKHKDKINESSKGHYVAHLNKCFDAGLSLMLPADKNDLGFHCFGP